MPGNHLISLISFLARDSLIAAMSTLRRLSSTYLVEYTASITLFIVNISNNWYSFSGNTQHVLDHLSVIETTLKSFLQA